MPKNKEQDSGTAECYSPTDFEVQYRNLAEQAFVGVYVVEDKKFIYANPRMAEIFGYTVNEFVGKLGPVNVIHPDDYAHIYEKSQKRLIGEIKTDYYKFRGVKKDGGIIHVEIYGSRFQHQGKPAVTGVLSDITQRVKAEEDLKQELQHEKDLSEQAFVGVYAVQNGKFVYANPRMAEIFGYTVNEFIGKLGPVNVIHPEDFPHIHIKGNKRLNCEIETDYYQFRGIKKDGSVIHVEIYGSRIQFIGKPAITGVLNDITPRVNAEEALTLELRRKKDFIDVASHELRTPLQLVLGYLDVMLAFPDKYGLNDEGKRFQGLIMDSAKREERIVDRMLEYSIMNVEGEEIRPENRSFSPQSVVDVILNARKVRSDAEVEVEIPADMTIESDPDFFYNILAEFCTNAIQYSVPPRKITITGSQDELQSCFSVKDNGNGMTAEVRNSLFEPFFIGDGTQLSRKYGRLGLGLPIAKRLADLLGGDIKVKSEAGKGSTFTLILPRKP